VTRLVNDQAFQTQYRQNPDATLEAYLTPDEIRAIKTGDGHRLTEWGCGEQWPLLTAALCGPDPGP
jgi:hypothetical protein